MGWEDNMPIKRLSEISDGTDIHELQTCIYPGGHCPLFGVHLTLENISGVSMLVIGTADCGFYAYKTMKNFADPRKHRARILCGVLEEFDVIHGCGNDLKMILLQLDQDPETKMIVVITSCVIELIGDDIDGIVHEMKKKCKTPISVIRTENFKTTDYLQGVEKALESVTHLLSQSKRIPKSFSVLGPRFPGIQGNRIIQKLMEDGYTMRAEFPCNTNWEAIGKITGSSFIIVADGVAVHLARRIEQDFAIPFVDLSQNTSWEGMKASYAGLSRITEISYADELNQAEKRVKRIRTQLKQIFQGKKFIIGNIMGSPFNSARLIAEIGGEIELILAGNIHEKDREPISKLLELNQDPLVIKNANTAAFESHSNCFNADFHIGMGWSRISDNNKTQFIPMGPLAPLLGTDYLEKFYDNLLAYSNKGGASLS